VKVGVEDMYSVLVKVGVGVTLVASVSVTLGRRVAALITWVVDKVVGVVLGRVNSERTNKYPKQDNRQHVINIMGIHIIGFFQDF